MDEFVLSLKIILIGAVASGIAAIINSYRYHRRRAMKNVKPISLKKKVPIRRSPCDMVFAGDMLADLKALYSPKVTFHGLPDATHAHPLISKPIPLN
jgi:hypothetical protein